MHRALDYAAVGSLCDVVSRSRLRGKKMSRFATARSGKVTSMSEHGAECKSSSEVSDTASKAPGFQA